MILLEERRPRIRGRHRSEAFRQRPIVVEATCRLRARASGRLGDEREADLFAESKRFSRVAHEAMAGARKSVAREHRFHARFVAKIPPGFGAHAGDTELLANLTQGHLKLLERSEQAIDRPKAALHRARGLFDRSARKTGFDAVVARQLSPQVLGELLRGILADEAEPHVRKIRRGAHEAKRRLREIRRDENHVRHGSDYNPPMLRIAFLASELTPFAKTGGLADVAEALPRALGKLGHDVRVFMPLYGSIDGAAHGLEPVEASTEGFALQKGTLPRSSVPVYFIDAPRFFARDAIYTNDEDEPFRFLFFCRAVETCHHLAFAPEIFHLNDWQTALVPLLLKTAPSSFFDEAKTLLTIHNLAYQGVFSADVAKSIGVRESKGGIVNFLETGLVHADHLSTVSPTYAEEIQTPEQGYGLDGLLRRCRAELVGILNGVDYDTWSPAKDELIPFRYTENNLDGKKQNKKALLKELSLSQPEDVPLVGMVTRLSAQKGLDLLVEALPELLSRESCSLVVLGTGDAPYEEFFASLQRYYPDRVCFYRGFHDRLAHWIEAACDMFLMPHLAARDRDLRHSHGVVLRAEGSQVLGDRLPAAWCRRLGPLWRRQRDRPLSRVGRCHHVEGYEPEGVACLRGRYHRAPPERDGRIIGYEGIASIENELGQWILDYHLPRAGEPTQPVEGGYMANAWIRMRHPNYDELREMLNHVGETVKVRAE